jgi:hypothetical protein
MNEIQKMLAKMFPQSEQSINERAYKLSYGEDPRDREDYDPRIGYDFFKGEQFNIADIIREAKLSPKEYDKFIDLVKKNESHLRNIDRDQDEVTDIFSRIYNPDNSTGTPQLPDNTKRRMPRGVDQGFGVMTSLAEVLAGRESSPSLEKSPRSKSIDDILRESDLVEVLSKSDRDATNVDVTRQKNMESSTVEELLKMFGDSNQLEPKMDAETMMRLLSPQMQEPLPLDVRRNRMDAETMMRLLSPQMQEPIPPR